MGGHWNEQTAVEVEVIQGKEKVLYWGVEPWSLMISCDQGIYDVDVYGDPAATGGQRKIHLEGKDSTVARGFKIVINTHEHPALVRVTPGPS